MTTFKLGDYAKILHAYIDTDKIGQVRRVVKVDGFLVYLDGCERPWANPTDSLEKVEYPICVSDWACSLEPFKHDYLSFVKPTLMNKITQAIKRTFSPSSQALYEVEFINGAGEMTETGKKELLEILFQENEAKLLKRAAEIKSEAKEK